MKSIKNVIFFSSLLLLLLSISACTGAKKMQEEVAEPIETADLSSPTPAKSSGAPTQLPIQYQTPSYKVDRENSKEALTDEETGVKVGATIRSTRGPQPLWDILKRLAALKNMNVSWASDVDRDVLVDVDINANDDFYDAIDNMLRQVDYFHEIQNNTIVVKYKETRQFHIAMPFIKSAYKTSTGGNMLGNNQESENIDGTVEIKSEDNTFDIWQSVQTNMDAILETWSTVKIDSTPPAPPAAGETNVVTADAATAPDAATAIEAVATPAATRRYSQGGNMYIIDKPIGLITVSAPRPLLDELDSYFASLQKELYKQISIDAKIIEVELSSGSSVGIDWGGLLKSKSISGSAVLGENGQIWGDNDTWLPSGSKFLSTVTIPSIPFDLVIGALNEQGDAKVLSNPKISVMNGQPALITVGRTISYISAIEADHDSDTNTITYTTETDSLLSGLGLGITATILNDNQIVMNLVPVTSQLTTEEVKTVLIGNAGGSVGLPEIDVREMSTTVRIADGDTLIIGGLISETNDKKGSSVPVLGSIPGIGRLFSYEEKTAVKKELVILIRPRII